MAIEVGSFVILWAFGRIGNMGAFVAAQAEGWRWHDQLRGGSCIAPFSGLERRWRVERFLAPPMLA